jgi:hypothetical protein
MRPLFAVALSLVLGAVAGGEETIEIDARSDDPVFSSPLIDGQWYLLEARGTYQWSIYGFRADAEWLQDWNDEVQPTWDVREEYLEDTHDPERRLWGMELLVNGEDRDWLGTTDGETFSPHVFSPSHVYRQYIQGTGNPVSFDIYDWPGAPGNSGSLQVEISPLAVPEPSTILLLSLSGLCLLGYAVRRRWS